MRSSSRVIRRVLGLTAALCLALGVAGGASAQDASCKADVEKFCPSAQPGGGRIAQCLKQHEAELSAPCKQRLTQLTQDLRSVGQACENDLHTYCSGVQPGEGRIGACLKENQDKLSVECKSKIAETMQKK